MSEIDPQRIINFISENDVKITVKDYGRKHDYRPQIMLTSRGANIPLSGDATGPIIQAIVALMTAHGIQTTYR